MVHKLLGKGECGFLSICLVMQEAFRKGIGVIQTELENNTSFFTGKEKDIIHHG